MPAFTSPAETDLRSLFTDPEEIDGSVGLIASILVCL